jgi:TM2 domain-containing membrane protein YozV
MVLFFAILIFIVFLILPTSKKIKKRTGKLIDKGIASEKNVKISAILSIIIPGLGQIYNGEVMRGILYIILIGGSGILAMLSFDYGVRMMIISGLIYVIIEITSIIDAYRIAVNINRSLVEHERVPKKNVHSAQK